MTGLAAVLCVLATLLLAPTAAAAVPPNDAFANAQALTGAPISINGSNVDATVEAGETPPYEARGSVWYAWTAPASARYRIGTCGSGFDTILGIYTGATLATLTAVTDNDDGCGLASRVDIDAVAGVAYRITVAGFGGEEGAFPLAIAELHPPANDAFAAAAPLGAASVSGTTADAGREAGEPFDHGGDSVWYAWTAPAGGAYRIQTCGSATDAVPALYAGSQLTALTARSPYALGDWRCPGTLGRYLVARVTAGETLRIAVGNEEPGAPGAFTLRIAPEGAPANDAFAAATPVSGTSWEFDGLAIAAGGEPGEPPHGGASAARTVWLRWTAPANDRFVLAVDGNVRIGLYTGTALTALAPVATVGDPAVDGALWFATTAGTEYRIAVSWSEAEPYPTGGRFQLRAFEGGLSIAPRSLRFAPQTVGTISGSNVVALRPSALGLAAPPFDVSVRGRDAGDFLKASDDCGEALAECAVAIRFAPSAPGERTAVLVVETTVGPYTVALSGSGTMTPVLGPPLIPPPAAIRPAAAATCRLARNTRRGAVVRCTVTRTPRANGTVSAALLRGKATRAKRSAPLRAGKATLQLTTRRRLAAGRYRVTLSIAVRGQPRLAVTRSVRVR